VVRIFGLDYVGMTMFDESIRKKLPKLLEELEKEPLRVCVEPTNACNALCSFCANKDCKRERKIMNHQQLIHLLRNLPHKRGGKHQA